MSWATRAAENLLPLSKENDNLKVALKEWLYTGEMHDLEEAEEFCELCNHPNIRYQFLIENSYSLNALWIGSECINKFQILAIDQSGQVLNESQTKEKVAKDRRKLITDAKEKSMINSLIALSVADDEFKIESFIEYYKKRGSFTPKQLSTLIWRLDKHDIEYKKYHFKTTIKRKKEKEQLENFAEWQINKIWKCLSSSQKEYCKKNSLFDPD